MSVERGVLCLVLPGGARRDVGLTDALGVEGAEQAARDANAWIKGLRHARVDGLTLRDRFTYRDDSLWWFAELFLHKEGQVTSWFETLGALERAIAAHRPAAIEVADGDEVLLFVGPLVAARHGTTWRGPRAVAPGPRQALRLAVRSRYFTWSAIAGRWRPREAAARPAPGGLAAFVHSAFWRREAGGGSGEEGYVGPVLRALDARAPGRLHLVGVGPRANFRARRWWHGVVGAGTHDAGFPFSPIEALAPRPAIASSIDLWHARHEVRAALERSSDLRALSVVAGVDLWTLVRPELAGIALLQFPWSARAMDEAGAALDALQPAAVITYAEAGGWGRALALEARRRRVPSVGLQHGFIYRHWLNYLHEPDEMRPSVRQPTDVGFPRPDLTLLYDGFAERHLLDAGRFPPESLRVTGSPGLDVLFERMAKLGETDIEAVRRDVGARPGDHVVLVATKYAQVRPVFADLVKASAAVPDVKLVVKCHPAETPEPYQADAAGAPHVSIAPASADLARLVAAARVVVTVNSTVAIDAMALDVPALVVALPSNLTPFVDAGVMAGASGVADIVQRLRELVHDDEARARLAGERREFLVRHRMVPDGRAAERAAGEILRLAGE